MKKLILIGKSFFGDPAARIVLKSIERKGHKIAICGMGEIGLSVFSDLKELMPGQVEFSLYDSKAEYNRFAVNGVQVKALKELNSENLDQIVIASVKFKDEIMHQVIDQTGCPANIFVHLDS